MMFMHLLLVHFYDKFKILGSQIDQNVVCFFHGAFLETVHA